MLTSGWVLDGSDSDKVLAGTALGVSTYYNNVIRDEISGKIININKTNDGK
jgi:hypothetical protein